MNSRFQAEITKIEKAGGGAIITFEAKGKVANTSHTAQEATMNGTVFLKTLVVKDISIGSTLTIMLNDEEPADRSM